MFDCQSEKYRLVYSKPLILSTLIDPFIKAIWKAAYSLNPLQ